MEYELEVKFLNINKSELQQKLSAIGANRIEEEHLMKRKTFDFPKFELDENEYKWMRVRDEGKKITMTLKHVVNNQKIDNTKEVELIVDSFENACMMLLETDWIETNYQENYREKWILDGAEITIDTWPTLESLVEIEAKSEEHVKDISKKLEFDYSTAIFGTVDFVYEKIHGLKPNDLTKVKVLTFERIEELLKQFQELKDQN